MIAENLLINLAGRLLATRQYEKAGQVAARIPATNWIRTPYMKAAEYNLRAIRASKSSASDNRP